MLHKENIFINILTTFNCILSNNELCSVYNLRLKHKYLIKFVIRTQIKKNIRNVTVWHYLLIVVISLINDKVEIIILNTYVSNYNYNNLMIAILYVL